MEDNGQEVTCLLCLRRLAYINYLHLRAYHRGLTTLEYMEMFPGTPLQSSGMVEDRVSQLRDVSPSPDTCEKISVAMVKVRKRQYWNTWHPEEGYYYEQECPDAVH